MRLRLAGIGIALLALAGAACGGREEVSFGGAPPPSSVGVVTTTAAPTPLTATGGAEGLLPPPGATPVPPAQIDASALPPGYPSVVWRVGDADLGVYGQAGGCVEAGVHAVEQSPGRVVLRITETMTSTGPCTMEITYPALAAALDAPLGTRTVMLTRQQVGPR